MSHARRLVLVGREVLDEEDLPLVQQLVADVVAPCLPRPSWHDGDRKAVGPPHEARQQRGVVHHRNRLAEPRGANKGGVVHLVAVHRRLPVAVAAQVEKRLKLLKAAMLD